MSVPPEVAAIITRKKLWYCRIADTKQWPDMVKIALPGAEFKFYQTDGSFMSFEGVDFNFSSTADFVKFYGEIFFPQLQTIHLVGPGDLEQIGRDEVKAVWTVVFHAGPKESNSKFHHTGGGHYYETWKRKDDDWFVKSIRLESTYFWSSE
ncbi:uncharacterized protein F4822DRAFT_233919 [Hypoxylon trugodes]|uniref:uncharacterized protein n=1 Tax=Hypoxylon trugodes TaxID=326681 RepID=UPI0021910981|nr:uncharacterized protein F4822DRAFT_233919 [Hypoxylon trugodes]KAI1390360.1 hypothetical protein F4822DRAFT_233919 [Hypoxylon trugodes]